jgi:hypothetical protein
MNWEENRKMELTKDIIDEVVLAAHSIEYGSITISITGKPSGKVVDIITEKRERYRECTPTTPGAGKYQKDKYE